MRSGRDERVGGVPADELAQAQRVLLFAQFHDILPGSSIQKVEESALRLMGHGLRKS